MFLVLPREFSESFIYLWLLTTYHMSFTVFKKIGNKTYAYETTSIWDKELKKVRKKTKYLGQVVDKEKKIFQKKQLAKEQGRLTLDFGDAYVSSKFLEQNGFANLLRKSFPEKSNELLALISYKLCYNGAMMYAKTWLDGSYASIAFKKTDLSGQRISEYLKHFGNEVIQQRFFEEYLNTFTKTGSSLVLDTTSIPNQIHMPLTNWGLNCEEIDKQIRFLLVVDKKSKLPLFFRLLPGNIVDVSTLSNTLTQLKNHGVKDNFVCMDAGFFSEDNVKEMYAEKINFLTRLPSGRILYKNLIENHAQDLQSKPFMVKYGKRGLFIKRVAIDLFGQKGFAYLVLDPVRKGREINRLTLQTIEEKLVDSEVDFSLLDSGVMVLVSSFEISVEDIVPAYYARQAAEMLFGFSKDDLGLLPLRVHSEGGVRGFLFLQFVSLVAFMMLRKQLGRTFTVEQVLLTLRNLKCRVYPNEVLVGECTRLQREMAEKLGVMVPKNLGI